MSLGLEPAEVRVVAPDVGGGFGAKMLGVEEILVPGSHARRAARSLDRDPQREHDRDAHGRGASSTSRSAGAATETCRRTGLRILQDVGAYPRLGAVLPG